MSLVGNDEKQRVRIMTPYNILFLLGCVHPNILQLYIEESVIMQDCICRHSCYANLINNFIVHLCGFHTRSFWDQRTKMHVNNVTAKKDVKQGRSPIPVDIQVDI